MIYFSSHFSTWLQVVAANRGGACNTLVWMTGFNCKVIAQVALWEVIYFQTISPILTYCKDSQRDWQRFASNCKPSNLYIQALIFGLFTVNCCFMQLSTHSITNSYQTDSILLPFYHQSHSADCKWSPSGCRPWSCLWFKDSEIEYSLYLIAITEFVPQTVRNCNSTLCCSVFELVLNSQPRLWNKWLMPSLDFVQLNNKWFKLKSTSL